MWFFGLDGGDAALFLAPEPTAYEREEWYVSIHPAGVEMKGRVVIGAMRQRARDDEAAGKAANRRDAEDAAADAEKRLVDTREAFDKAALAMRAGNGSDATVAAARAAWTSAQKDLNRQQAELRKIESQSRTPLPTETEGELNVARSKLRLSIAELERLTIRAPIASTVLQVNAKVGELASPTSPQPLMLLGDLSELRVRAEVDEDDIGKIRLGGKVVVRSDALGGREFAGKVAAIAPSSSPETSIRPHRATDQLQCD